MSSDLKPTKKQMELLRKIEAGQKLIRFQLRNGSTYYVIGDEKVHMNTAQSLHWNGWVEQSAPMADINPRVRQTYQYSLTLQGLKHLKPRADRPMPPMW